MIAGISSMWNTSGSVAAVIPVAFRPLAYSSDASVQLHTMNADYKTCPQCGQPAVPKMQTCQRCGHGYSTPPPNKTLFFQNPVNPYPFAPQWDVPNQDARTNIPMITTMWVLTACAFFGAPSLGLPVAVLLDIPALILAILLVITKNATNRANGWAKIGIECVAFVVGFLSAYQPWS
jgi:predicted RNA-binding Zn-ribbon protein involved in translation (DUF1610 family)